MKRRFLLPVLLAASASASPDSKAPHTASSWDTLSVEVQGPSRSDARHLATAAFFIARGDTLAAADHLAACRLDPAAFTEAERAAFLLCELSLRSGRTDRFLNIAGRVTQWKGTGDLAKWTTFRRLLVEMDRGGAPEAIRFLEASGIDKDEPLLAAYMKTLADPTRSWGEVARMKPGSPLEEEVAAAAAIRAAADILEEGGDPTPFLDRVPQTSRLRARGELLAGLHDVNAAEGVPPASREAVRLLASGALDRRAWPLALERAREAETSWTQDSEALEAIAANDDVDALWDLWAGDSRAIAATTEADLGAVLAEARNLRERPKTESPPRKIGLTSEAPYSFVPPPGEEDLRRVRLSGNATTEAQSLVREASWRVEEREAELERRRAQLQRGQGLTSEEAAQLAILRSRAEALLARLDETLARTVALKEAAALHAAARLARLVAASERHLVWIDAMRDLHVEGPNLARETWFPAGVPSPPSLLDGEEPHAAAMGDLGSRLATSLPELLERSLTDHWLPGWTDRADRLRAALERNESKSNALASDLGAAHEGLASDPALAALRDDMTARTATAESLAIAHRELRASVARDALAKAREKLDVEHEGIDYLVMTATYEAAMDDDSRSGREESFALMERFLARYPDSFARGETRYRLADIHLARAKEDFEETLERFAGKDAAEKQEAFAAFLDVTPALALYRTLLAEDPDFPHQDAVLMNLGMLLTDQSDPEGEGYLETLLASFPESPHVQEAALRLGDLAYERGDLKESLSRFGLAASGGDPAFRSIALYKTGWTAFRLEDFDGATRSFRALLDLHASEARASLKGDLSGEAEEHLVHALARAGGASAFERCFPVPRESAAETRVLHGLSTLLREHSLFAEAIETDALFLERYPNDPGALQAARLLVETYDRWERPEDANAARDRLALRFVQGTSWHAANAGDSLRAEGEAFGHESLRTIALSAHHRARGGDEAAWSEAFSRYETLLERWPNDADARKHHAYAGEAAGKLGRYEEGIAHFTIASNDTGALALDAAWQAVALTDLWHGKDPNAMPAAGVREAALRFAQSRPEDPRALTARWRRADLAESAGLLEEAALDYEDLVRRYPDDARAPVAAALRGDALYRAEQYDRAGDAYEEALRIAERAHVDSLSTRLRPLVPQAHFRHAESLAEKDPAGAAAAFEHVARTWPEDPHATSALYLAGLRYADAGRNNDAVLVWTRLADSDTTDLSRDARIRIAKTWDATGDSLRAAEAYLTFSTEHPEIEGSSDALLTAADRFDAADRPDRARALRLDYVKKYPGDVETGTAILADVAREELAHVSSGSLPPEKGPVADYLARAQSRPDLADPEILAHVAFLRAESLRAPFEAFRLTQPIEKSIKKKQALLQKLLEAYGATADLGSPAWTRAASFATGEALVSFGEALEGSELPRDLADEDLNAYRDVLAEQAGAFYDRGEAAWEALLRDSNDASDDPGGWIAKTQETLWPRLATRFAFRPEMPFPVLPGKEPATRTVAELSKPATEESQ